MRAAEMREMSREDLVVHLAEVHEELFNLRFQNATGRLDNYGRLGALRKEAARIETVITEGDLGIEREVTLESEKARDERPRRRLFRRAPKIDEGDEVAEAEAEDDEAAKAEDDEAAETEAASDDESDSTAEVADEAEAKDEENDEK